MDHLELRRASGPELTARDLYAALALRAQVFVVEQACAYLDPDGLDLAATTTHLWLADGSGTTAAYLRVLAEPGGGHRIGRVVTHPDHRGQALSAVLMEEALGLAEPPVVLDAESHLTSIYERHGFEVDGPEFLDDGVPHTPMRLR